MICACSVAQGESSQGPTGRKHEGPSDGGDKMAAAVNTVEL